MREGIWGRHWQGTAWCQQNDDEDEKEAICMGNRERGKRDRVRENSLLCVGHSEICGVFIHWSTHCSQLKLSLYMNHKKWFMYAHTKLIVPVNNTLMPWQ